MAGKPEFQSLPKTIVAWKQDDLGFFQGGQQGHRGHHGDGWLSASGDAKHQGFGSCSSTVMWVKQE